MVEEIEHCLLALPGTLQSDLRLVISDAAALSHCDVFVRGLPGVVRQAVDDSAGAAKMVAENRWR
jgi:prephenate dehydratase